MATKRQARKATTRKGARTFDALLRVSRLNGREGNTFHSVEMQRQAIEQWAAMNNGTIARWFDESKSVSGGTTKRDGLQTAMTRACKGTTDGVIVSAVDRFARSLTEGVEEIKRLQDHGRSFVAVEQGIDTANNTEGSIGNLMLGFMFLLAAWQRDALTEKWNVVRARHITQGKYTQEPFGYLKDGNGVLAPVADEAAIIVEVFERRAAGEGWGAIATALNAAGYMTRAGKAFRPEGVQRITTMRVYLGEISSGHELVNADAHPAIITRELFDRVQARLRKAGTVRKETVDAFLLTGILRCAGCGQTMVGSTVNGDGGGRPRYRCRRSHAFGTCERPANVMAADVDAYVTEALFNEAQGVAVEGGTSTDVVDAARAHLDACESALVAWATDTANDVLRASAPDAYAQGTDVRVAARDAAQTAFDNAKAAAGAHGALPRNLVDVWGEMSNAERRGWLSSFFAVVAVRAPSRPKAQEHVSTRVAWWVAGDGSAPTGFAHLVGNRHRVARCPIMW